MEAITIKDIAKALQLSTSTVSRALRGSYEINPETKKLVLEYAEKMNYHPNPIALSLKENKSRAIGVIVPEIANHFFSQAINGIEAAAFERGYHVVIFQSHESYEREQSNIRHLVGRKVDGVLISLSGQTTETGHLLEIRKRGIPLVVFDRITDSIETNRVVADNFQGAYQATEYLIKKGRKRIAHITSPSLLYTTQERLDGYKAALDAYDIDFDENLVRYCGFAPEEAQKEIFDVLESQKPDAIFTASDRLALDSFTALKVKRVRIPEEVAFIGFTNLGVAHLLDPPLSTIVQPAFEIGKTAADILLDTIEKKVGSDSVKTIKIPVDIHIRASSG